MLEAQAAFVRSDEPIISLVDNEVIMLRGFTVGWMSSPPRASDPGQEAPG
jgi:hypothetical protein